MRMSSGSVDGFTPTRSVVPAWRRVAISACCCSGYFEGLDSERAIAWRAADSLSVRSFLGLELHEAPPDHSTVSRTRRLIDIETHQAVFTWVLQRLAAAESRQGEDDRDRRDDAGSQRGAAQYRAA